MKFQELDTVKVSVKLPSDDVVIEKGQKKTVCGYEIENRTSGRLTLRQEKFVEKRRGLIIACNESAFGETYRILWDDGVTTVMHGSMIEKAKLDVLPGKN